MDPGYFKELFQLKDVGAETLAELERRAGVSAEALLDGIRRDRVRYPDSDSSQNSASPTCNNPSVVATGILKKFEETKAYKMLVMISEFRDGSDTSRFSLRHAYTAAGITRSTMVSWRRDHPLFNSIMESLQEEMVDTMRAEAYRRAVIGHDEPIVHQGAKTGETVKKFSDGLLQFTLMGYDAKFRAKDVNMNVSGQLNTNVNIEGLRDRLAQRLQQKVKAEE